jgi:serine phosphatase RsbU (regulator of sigma subunit)
LSQTIATAIAVQLFDNGKVQLANAGHPQPLLIGPNGCEFLPVAGPLLGLASDSMFAGHDINLDNDHRLFLYTDGLAEIGDTPKNHEINFGRIQSLLGETKTIPVDTSMAHLRKRIQQLISGQAEDDLTCVLLEIGD